MIILPSGQAASFLRTAMVSHCVASVAAITGVQTFVQGTVVLSRDVSPRRFLSKETLVQSVSLKN